MIEKYGKRFQALANTIDQFATLDLTGSGLIKGLFEARSKYQPLPMCLKAAELIVTTLKEKGPVLIATGFSEGDGVPETDGPVGAAVLARALFLGLGVHTIIVIDNGWQDCIKAACIGAGLVPIDLPESRIIPKIERLRPVFIRTVPKDWNQCYEESDSILNTTKPKLMVAIERPGKNRLGIYHYMNGGTVNDLMSDLDYLFLKGKKMGIPFIGFGDGGNELGMGVLKGDLPKILPKAVDCGCPCRGGIGADIAADLLVVASVSNWGVTAVVAALALLLENPAIMHDPEAELRSIELCTAAGAVDGISDAPSFSVDGITATEWGGLIRTMKGILLRGMKATGNDNTTNST